MTRQLDEQYENTSTPGYDESGWSEAVGSGSTVDENADPSDVSDPDGWSGECLKAVSTGNDAYSYNTDLGYGDSFWRDEFVVTSESLSDGHYNKVVGVLTSGWGVVWQIRLFQDSGNFNMQIRLNRSGSNTTYNYLSNPISLNTLYRVEVKWDNTNDVWAWRVNGVDQPNDQDSTDPIESEGTLTGTHATDLDIVFVGLRNPNAGMTIYHDLTAMDDADWVGAEAAGLSIPVAMYNYGNQ